jgi:hypothetical protein
MTRREHWLITQNNYLAKKSEFYLPLITIGRQAPGQTPKKWRCPANERQLTSDARLSGPPAQEYSDRSQLVQPASSLQYHT